MFGKSKEYTAVGPIYDGLPVPAETICIVKLFPEGFKIQALTGRNKDDWKNFELGIDKIENVQLMNERQIKEIIEQSAPGMVLGAATFGIIGAMVGGRVRTKEKVVIKTLLVIDYFSGEKKQLVFNVSDNLKDSERLLKYFKELKPIQNQPVQL